ncbi:MAG: DUF456 domain-containing protein [Gammaproteobacteria bacterium]
MGTALLWLAVAALVLIGLAGAVLPAIPGVPLVFAGLWLGAWIDGYAKVSAWWVGVFGVLTLVAMAVDLIATALGAKRVGASRQAISGAVIGTFAGLFFGGPFGILLGPFVGAVAGELIARGRVDQAMDVGIATWMGFLFGTLAKIALSLAMIGLFVGAYFL